MKVKIEPGFAAFVLLIYALSGELVWPLLLAAALHELAHLVTMWALGCRAKALTLRFADAKIDAASMSYPAEIACALAGPAANLLCCWAFRMRAPVFAAVSLLLGCYNLLPVQPLDGGRALCAALSLALPADAAQRISAAVSVGLCAALVLAAGYAAAFCGAGVWPLLAALTLALRLGRLGARNEKQVAFAAAGG